MNSTTIAVSTTGNRIHIAKSETETVCGKDIKRLLTIAISADCKVCTRQSRTR